MRDTMHCSLCGAVIPAEEACSVGEDWICDDCRMESTVLCECCGERIYSSDNAGDNRTPLCRSCYDRSYTTCQHCGRTILEEDAYYDSDDDPYCYDCYTRHHRRFIHDYYYKPEPIFYGEGNRYMGVELEIDDGGETDANAEKILAVANRDGDELMYAKHDGSLNDGFELVTAPCSLHYHCTQVPWGDVLETAKKLNYLSHGSGTAGLHIHVSRAAFGENADEQDCCIARILYFFEKHWEELLKFSRRTRSQMEQWAARYGYKDRPMDILEHAKKGTSKGRYACVNLENTHTIEFRIFRGTLKLNTLIASMQMIDKICDLAIYLSDEELKALSWTSFVAGISKETYPELVQYLKERRLYVNEPVEMEVEV